MADMITLTPHPVRVTAATFQPIFSAVDIGAYDFLDMEAGIIGSDGGSALSALDLELWTGMQVQTDDGWVKVGAQFNFTLFGAGTYVSGNFSTGLLRYLRWKVVSFTGPTGVTFFVRGMARRYA